MNFDVYKNDPKAAANLIAREGDCGSCPMYKKCGAAPNHDYNKCFEMWMRFFKLNSEMLESVDDFSELLSIMIDCDKCTVKKVNECDFHETRDCGLTFCRWLCRKFVTIHEPRQVGLGGPDEADDCEPAVSFNGNLLKRLAQAAKKMEPDKEYTLTEIEMMLRDSENEAERS